MARQETIFTVFLASPSDVEEERSRVEKVIDELNATWSRNLNVRLELVKWESHAVPGFGTDAQEVINKQMPNDYDLFIGIMWYRFGTPTNRAGSGTEEEFRQAKVRYESDENSVQMMMYFKDAPPPIAISELDPTQLASVMEFRHSLKNEGGLIWTFKTADEFETQTRLHLSRYIQQWASKTGVSIAIPEKQLDVHVDTAPTESPEEDEPGVLDLAEAIEDEFLALNEITDQIADATGSFGNLLQERNAEINEFNNGPEAKNIRSIKRLITKISVDMDNYAHRMESEIPMFAQHLERGMNGITSLATLAIEFNVEDRNIPELRNNVAQIEQQWIRPATRLKVS